MKLQIEIDLSGTEFTGDPQRTVARLLERFADVIERGNFGLAEGASWTPFDERGEIAGRLRVTNGKTTAAPDLLAALRNLLRITFRTAETPEVKAAIAAIAAAEREAFLK